jgi:hypothetical protein
MERHAGKRSLLTLITGTAFQLSSAILPSTLCLFVFYSISAVPAFPSLRRFPDGRDFSQWTGDDSKALMKVDLFSAAN